MSSSSKEEEQFKNLTKFFKQLRSQYEFRGDHLTQEHINSDANLKAKYEKLKKLAKRIKKRRVSAVDLQHSLPNTQFSGDRNKVLPKTPIPTLIGRKRRIDHISGTTQTTYASKRMKLMRSGTYHFDPYASSHRNGWGREKDLNEEKEQENQTTSNQATRKDLKVRTPLGCIDNVKNIQLKRRHSMIGLNSYRKPETKIRSPFQTGNGNNLSHIRQKWQSEQEKEETPTLEMDDNRTDDDGDIDMKEASNQSDSPQQADPCVTIPKPLPRRANIPISRTNASNSESSDSDDSSDDVNLLEEYRKGVKGSDSETSADDSSSPATPVRKRRKKKAQKKAKTARKRKKSNVTTKKQASKTAKKKPATKKRRKKKSDVVSKNFVKLDMKHKYSRGRFKRRKSGGFNPAKRFYDKFGNARRNSSYWTWKKQTEKKESTMKSLLTLDNSEQLKKEMALNAELLDGRELNLDGNGLEVKVPSAREKLIAGIPDIPQVSEELESSMNRVLQQQFGYESFRKGQKEAIQLLLQKQSCVVLLPTGAGKSLCYQMPAYFLKKQKCLTLVVSPLISLMKDQCENLPPCLSGTLWNHSHTAKEIYHIRNSIIDGDVDILYVSPEKLDSNTFRNFLRKCLGDRLQFACIDEAHCISEWSHNFRPSYLRLKAILRDFLYIPTILACTATATKITQNSIIENLEIPRTNVISALSSRDNLHLTVSRTYGKDKCNQLLNMLESPRFKNLTSIIIYVRLKKDANELAIRINSRLAKYKKKVEAYHGGMKREERTRIQNNFMNGRLDIIVATIAFGMGLDKADVRAVIHYTMPKTMEHYVQEVGRAGRDGLPSECHLFYHSDDLTKQKSWIYQDGVDLQQIEYILYLIFCHKKRRKKKEKKQCVIESLCLPEMLKDATFRETGEIVAIRNSYDYCETLDLKPMVAHTILTYLDIYQSEYVKLLPPTSDLVRIGLLKQTMERELMKQSEVMTYVFENVKQRKNGFFTCRLSQIANAMRESDVSKEYSNIWTLQQYLKDLQVEGKIILEWDEASFFIFVKQSLEDVDELYDMAKQVHTYLQLHERVALEKINTLSQALKLVATENPLHSGSVQSEDAVSLHAMVDKYFTCESHDDFLEYVQSFLPEHEHIRTQPVSSSHFEYQQIVQNARAFIEDYSYLRPRAIARIFHGLHAPAYSIKDWGNNQYWAKHKEFPFLQLLEVITNVKEQLSQPIRDAMA